MGGRVGARAGSALQTKLCHAARPAKPALMIYAFIGIIDFILQVATWIIFAQIILSWLVAFNVINTSSNFVRSALGFLDRVTEPLYRPIRKIMPDFGGIDFSPMVILLAIFLIRSKVLPGILLEVGPTIT